MTGGQRQQQQQQQQSEHCCRAATALPQINVLCLLPELPVLPVGCLDVGSVVLATVFGTTSACTSREERERARQGDGDERGQLGNSFRQASRQSPDGQTTRRSSSQDTIEFMYHFVYLCIIYDLCFNACLHNKLVSSPAPHTPLPSSSFPLLLPPLLCASLQSHIRRTILPIIETSFRRFVSFRSKPITVGQSNCLKSRDLLRSTVTVTVGASTLHNVLPSSPAIHPTACLVIQSSSGFI